MKISVITICFNSAETIEQTIKSVIEQSYKNIEYIIIDGDSSDGTKEIIKKYRNKITKFISEKDKGIYDAINKGIKIANGDIVSLLHGNDIFSSHNSLLKIVEEFKNNNNFDVIISDLAFKKNFKEQKIYRYYKAKYFKKWMLRIGYSPPHLSSFFRLKKIQDVGFYNPNFRIAGDFDFFVRSFLVNNLKFKILNECLIYMSVGGLSGRNIKSYLISSKEINQSLKSNGYFSNFLITFMRFPLKIIQFL